MSKILLVEDNEIAKIGTKLTLEGELGFEVDVVESGEKALLFAEKHTYDLILMDIGLRGELDGYATTREIRSGTSKNRQTPIIALTAHSDEETKKCAIQAGINEVMLKPIDVEKSNYLFKKYDIPWV